jgi:uncharacterized protein YggE
LSCLLVTGTLCAQNAAKPAIPTVRARGEAIVQAKPDQARIDIGVVTQAQTADGAAGQNAKQTSEVIAALKKELGAGAEIQTSGYSIQPNYRQPRDGSAPATISGYTASNVVHVVSPDVAAVGKMIDAATRAGANNVHGIQFTVKDEQAVRGEALKKAARNARINAEAMAAGLGMKLGRTVSLDDTEPPRVIPFRSEMMRAQAQAVVTPIEPGNVEVRAAVTITAELLP